jgi:hypothetical protein
MSLSPPAAHRPHALPVELMQHRFGAALHRTALRSTALYCTALYCTALCCTALRCTALRFAALRCALPHCAARHYPALCCAELPHNALQRWRWRSSSCLPLRQRSRAASLRSRPSRRAARPAAPGECVPPPAASLRFHHARRPERTSWSAKLSRSDLRQELSRPTPPRPYWKSRWQTRIRTRTQAQAPAHAPIAATGWLAVSSNGGAIFVSRRT